MSQCHRIKLDKSRLSLRWLEELYSIRIQSLPSNTLCNRVKPFKWHCVHVSYGVYAGIVAGVVHWETAVLSQRIRNILFFIYFAFDRREREAIAIRHGIFSFIEHIENNNAFRSVTMEDCVSRRIAAPGDKCAWEIDHGRSSSSLSPFLLCACSMYVCQREVMRVPSVSRSRAVEIASLTLADKTKGTICASAPFEKSSSHYPIFPRYLPPPGCSGVKSRHDFIELLSLASLVRLERN